jgi:hypothetical protein
MTTSKVPLEPTRFITQDPNNSRYSQRISQDEWGKHKALLLQLHQQGLTREAMVKELSKQRKLHVKKNQLDNQMTKWGVHIYKKRFTKTSTNSLDDSAGTDTGLQEPDAQGMHTQNNSQHEDVPMHDVGISSSRSSHDVIQRVDMLPQLAVERSGSRDLCSQSVTDVEDFTMADGLYEEFGHLADIEPRNVFSNSSIVTATIGRTDHDEPKMSQNTEVDGTSETPAIMISVPSTAQSNRDLAVPMTCNPTQWKENHFLSLPHYAVSPRVLMLYQTIQKKSQDRVITSWISRLNHAGTLLHALKAYDSAFDLFLLILRYHNDANPSKHCPSSSLILAILNCARSAQNPYQRHIASGAITRTLFWLEIRHSIHLINSTPTWRYLRKLRNDLSSNTTSTFYRRHEDVAHWAVVNMLISRNNASDAHVWLPDHFMNLWQDGGLRHLSECSTTRSSVLDALTFFTSYVKTNAKLIDSVLQEYWEPAGEASIHAARVLSCLLLHERHEGPTSPSSLTCHDSGPHEKGFPCALNGLAIPIMPFVIMERIRRTLIGPVVRLSIKLRQATRLKPSHLLLLAARDIQSTIRASPIDYTKFLSLYLESSIADGIQRKIGVGIVSSDWVFDVAAAAAELAPMPKLTWLSKFTSTSFGSVEAATAALADVSQVEDAVDEMTLDSSSSLRNGAISDRSSTSTDFRGFRALSIRVRTSMAFSVKSKQTISSDAMSMSSHSSWNLRSVTGIASFSSNSSVRDSFHRL